MGYCYVESPLGALLVTADGGGLTGLYLPGARHADRPALNPSWTRDDPTLTDARRQLDEYFAGKRTFFELAVNPSGTPFQLEAWTALRQIPYGETRTYAAQATAIGRPSAVRAIGAANGQNPISIVVPCHRVLGADGSLTGYGGGIAAKQWLLQHEASHSGLFAR